VGAWLTTGNAGTSPPTNFIGTIDNNDWVIRTNNLERVRVTNAGLVGVNQPAPADYLEVNSGASTTINSIYGHSNNVGGYVGYNTIFSFGVAVQTINGAGIWATNPNTGYTSIYCQTTGAANYAANISYSNVWMANYAYVDNASTIYNPAASYAQLNVTSTTLGGFQSAFWGYSGRGTTAGNPGYTVGAQLYAVSQNQDAFGVVAESFTNSGLSTGGYFTGNTYAGANYSFAYVAGRVAGANYKIYGTGTVNEIVPTPTHGRVTLTCPESPEYWYQDYGNVTLVNGKAHVDLDPILKDIAVIDADNPIKVICQPGYEDCKGLAVINKSAEGFDIVELNSGRGNGPVDYQIVVKPKTNYGVGRFNQAPGPGWLKADKDPASAKAANQPDPNKIFNWPADHIVYGYNPEDCVGIGDVIPAGPHAGKIKLGGGKYGEQVPAGKDKLK
jgi:hypothetical protein